MSQKNAPWYYLLLLILAGESVFILPFVIVRVFRPTVLDTFQLDNTQVGLCFFVYGWVALLSYLFGGFLADKFAPRKLIAAALWLTAIGGVYYSTFPDHNKLMALYGYWGFTTIFLFWAPMIKATRFWGGSTSQGKAFGFLDGGRGLVGALVGTIGVFVFTTFLANEVASANLSENRMAFKYVILTCAAITAIVGVLVLFFLKVDKTKEQKLIVNKFTSSELTKVLKLPSVYLLMIIILCAYVGYKTTDIISLYAQDVMLYDQVNSAKVGTFLLYIRPVVGILIGIIADKSQITLWLIISFILSFIGAVLFAAGILTSSATSLFFISVIIVATGVYAARALYFAVMKKGQIPLALTGTAVGLISLVGYTPDIFASLIMGILLDGSPGIAGHQNVFWMLAIFSFLGGIAAVAYHKLYRTPKVSANQL